LSIRHNQEPWTNGAAPRSASAGGRERRRLGSRASRAALTLLAALALAATMAPAGQAQGAQERSPEEEAAAGAGTTGKHAEQEERAAAKRAEKAARKAREEAEKEAARAEGEAQGGAAPSPMQETGRNKQNSTRERLHGDVHFSCTAVTWTYKGFNAGKNTVLERLRVGDKEAPEEVFGRVSFEGPDGENTMVIDPPGGTYTLDAFAKWKGNGPKGSWDILGKLKCPPRPELTIKKLQKLAGSEEALTASTITGQLGDTVEYSIVVKNTGNVPLTLGSASEPFSGFSDAHCDPGTLTGGTGGRPLAILEETRYRCTHLLDKADEAAGSYTNTATVTATPPNGDGPPLVEPSNPVVVTVSPAPPIVLPGLSLEKLQQIEGSGAGYTTTPLSGQVGQTVDYEILVDNTGNVPLNLEGLSDPRCDPGTLAGGVGAVALPVGASTSYTCKHVLVAADEAAGKYENTVSLVAYPPPGEGSPFAQTSNTVLVTVGAGPPAPAGAGGTGTGTGASGGVLSSTSSQPASKSGVLAFGAASLPRLKGALQGCARSGFRVSVKSADVASVTFYIDGHKLKTLTAKNAHKGLLSIEIDPAKLKVGVHRLTAKITMDHTGSAKALTGTRSMRILRCDPVKVTPKFTG
jgi:hypothetical protein